jgi:phosphoribosylglycinamide formyltransferase-1
MNAVLGCASVRAATHSAVFFGHGPGVEKASAHEVPCKIIKATTIETFSNELLAYIRANEIDYVLSFFAGFFSKGFRDEMSDRLINFHPSLLPSFKGMDSFGDGVAYHTKILGTTVELIKDVMDEGKIVMQTAFASDPGLSVGRLRHVVFNQQCKTLIQVVNWVQEGRVEIDGDRVTIRDANYDSTEFVPALEHPEAREFHVPFPGAVKVSDV